MQLCLQSLQCVGASWASCKSARSKIHPAKCTAVIFPFLKFRSSPFVIEMRLSLTVTMLELWSRSSTATSARRVVATIIIIGSCEAKCSNQSSPDFSGVPFDGKRELLLQCQATAITRWWPWSHFIRVVLRIPFPALLRISLGAASRLLLIIGIVFMS